MLVLVHRKPLVEQWAARRTEFTDISPRAIGRRGGGRRLTTKQIDIAMVQTLARADSATDFLRGYGHVVIDECHHVPAASIERQELVDALAKDALALLVALEGVPLPPAIAKAATLLASVVGQDLEVGEDGVFRIARRVAKNRIISTVDPDARHGHKTSARGFDGYKGHVAVDPDSELILATTSPASPGTRSRSSRRATGRSPTSARPEPVAAGRAMHDCQGRAHDPDRALRGPSLHVPAGAKPTPPGRPTTWPPARRSSAKSHT